MLEGFGDYWRNGLDRREEERMIQDAEYPEGSLFLCMAWSWCKVVALASVRAVISRCDVELNLFVPAFLFQCGLSLYLPLPTGLDIEASSVWL